MPRSLLSGIDFFPESYQKNCRIISFPSSGILQFSDGSPICKGQYGSNDFTWGFNQSSRLNQVVYSDGGAWQMVSGLSKEDKTNINAYKEENWAGLIQYWKRIGSMSAYRPLKFIDEIYYQPNKDFIGGDSFSFVSTNDIDGGKYYNSDSLEAWKEILVNKENKNTRISVLMNRNLSLSDFQKVLSLNYPVVSGCELSLFSTVNNQFEGVNWHYFNSDVRFLPSSYPLLDGITSLPLEQMIKSNGNKLGYKFRMYLCPKSSLDFSIVNQISSKDFANINQTGSLQHGKEYLFLAFTNSSVSVDRMTRYNENIWENRGKQISSNQTDRYSTNPFLVSIPFLGSDDYNLFASGQVGLVKNGIDIKSSFSAEFYYGEGGAHPHKPDGTDTQLWNRKELTTKQAITINVDAQNIQDIKIHHYISRNEINQTFESETKGDVSLEINANSVNWNYWNPVLLSQDILLNRSLRVNEFIDPPDYVQIETKDGKIKRIDTTKAQGDKLITDFVENQAKEDDKMEFVYV